MTVGVAFVHNNNAAYFAGFMLTSLGLITMFLTHFNMERLTIALLPSSEIHAEHPTGLRILLENKASQPVYQILVRTRDSDQPQEVPVIAPKHSQEIEVFHTFAHRGFQTPPTVIVETTFPFGLLKAWKILRPTEKLLVFPARKGLLILPNAGDQGEQDTQSSRLQLETGQNFIGHRPFQSRDSFRQIDWKAYARNQKLHIKVFENDEHGTQLLSWRYTNPGDDPELRICQLAQWVGVCQRQRLHFILETPNWKSKPDVTQKHVEECFTHLALWEYPTKKKGEKVPQRSENR